MLENNEDHALQSFRNNWQRELQSSPRHSCINKPQLSNDNNEEKNNLQLEGKLKELQLEEEPVETKVDCNMSIIINSSKMFLKYFLGQEFVFARD